MPAHKKQKSENDMLSTYPRRKCLLFFLNSRQKNNFIAVNTTATSTVYFSISIFVFFTSKQSKPSPHSTHAHNTALASPQIPVCLHGVLCISPAGLLFSNCSYFGGKFVIRSLLLQSQIFCLWTSVAPLLFSSLFSGFDKRPI